MSDNIDADKDLIQLLESQLKTSGNRYLNVRRELLRTLTSNAKLLEYIQYTEDQLLFYKEKALFNKKSEIHTLPQKIRFNNRQDYDMNIQQNQAAGNQINVSSTSSKAEESNGTISPNLQTYEKFVSLLSSNDLTMESFLSSICTILSFDAASIFSISHSLNKIQCELSTLTHLNNKCLNNKGFLSQSVKHKKRIIISNVNQTNFQFNKEIDDRFHGLDGKHETFTVCLEPLFTFDDEKNQKMVGILELVSCGNKNDEYNTSMFCNILQFSRNIASNLLSNILVKREFTNSNIHKEALLELAKVMSNNNSNINIENLIEKVRKTVYKSVKCDKVALFMVDEIRQELWCNASDDVAGIRLPLNKGIVGHTVTSGESLNIMDAYQDSRFNPSVDKKTNYRTKTIICVPIKYNNKIIGALECINKANEECFSETDLILLNKMAQETAPSLQNKFMESALRIISQGLQDSSSRDYLSQFMHNEDNYNIVKRVFTKRRHINNYNSPKMYLRIRNDIRSQNICTWNFDYFRLMEDDYQTAIPMMVYMFNDFGLLEKFNISEDKLYSFLIAVKKHYFDNPYHNFLHAFSVMHVTYLILKQTSMIKYFDILEILTIFISAICHDLEHPGLTNAYQVNSGSDLAMRYNDKSVLENHHAHIGSVLLKQPELAILAALTNEEMNKVRKSMIGIILHTDMSYHQDIVTQLLQLNNKKKDLNNLNESDKQFLSETLVHLGDLSNPVMRWDQSHEWSLRVIDEFVAQSQLEKEQKFKVSMAFITDKSPTAVSKVQTSFIDYVVKPLWSNAKNIAPELSDRLNVLDKNRQSWSKYPTDFKQLRQKYKCSKE